MKSLDGLTEIFDNILKFAHTLASTPQAHPELKHLCEFIIVCLTTGTDEILSRPDPRETEKARILLETEFLLRDFEVDPQRIEEWATAEAHRRSQLFGFGELRKRTQARQGTPPDMVLVERDHYRTHSVHSHPFPLSDVAPAAPDRKLGMLADLGDLATHAYKALQAAAAALSAAGADVTGAMAEVDLSEIEDGLGRIEWATTSHIPADELAALLDPVPKKRTARRFWDEAAKDPESSSR